MCLFYHYVILLTFRNIIVIKYVDYNISKHQIIKKMKTIYKITNDSKSNKLFLSVDFLFIRY